MTYDSVSDRFTVITPRGVHYHFVRQDNLYVHEFTIISSTARGVTTVMTRPDGNDRDGRNQRVFATPTTPAVNNALTAPSTTDATHFTPFLHEPCISLYIIPVMIIFVLLSTLVIIPDLILQLPMSLACEPSMVHVQVASWAK